MYLHWSHFKQNPFGTLVGQTLIFLIKSFEQNESITKPKINKTCSIKCHTRYCNIATQYNSQFIDTIILNK